MTSTQSPPAVNPAWAWQPYQPSAESPWDVKKAGHLFRRAAFGASAAELDTAVREGHEATITTLLRGRPDAEADALWTSMSESVARANNAGELPALWLYRMLYSTHPLREKLTLFWHNHFATSNLKVQSARYMLGQYDLMRRHAQGSFRALLTDMSRDPAMLIWLDTAQSQRNQPNENYARELMELFSLGIRNGRRPTERNYTEQDIRQAARAFTGWRVDAGRAVFRARDHDDGEKNVLGQRGNWQADDIVRICLEQESAPYFIVRKLFRFLVSETIEPTPELLDPLAIEFRRNYDFGALVERVLRSNLFFDPTAYRSRIKMPVSYALGIVRGLEGNRQNSEGQGGIGTLALASALEGLGQKLFYPPSVAGWEGGRAWLNGQTLLLRQNLALAMTTTTDNRFGRRLDPAPLLRRHNLRTDEQQVDFLLRVFLQGDAPPAARDRLLQYAAETRRQTYPVFWTAGDADDQRVRAVCHLVLCMPEFQLD